MITFHSFKHVLIFGLLTMYAEQIFSEPYNWTLLGPGDADQVTSLTVLKNGDLFAGIDIGGIYTSTDKGDSWKPINNGLNNLDVTTKIIQDKNEPSTLYVGTRGGLYKSLNYGKLWTRVSGGLPEIKKYALSGSIGGLVIDPFNSDIIYTALGYRPSSEGTKTVKKMNWVDHIYKSINSGNTWEKIIAFPKASKVTQLYHSPKVKNTLYAATSTGLYISQDAGNTWALILNKETLNIAIDSNHPEIIYAACNEDGVYKTTDNGQNWHDLNQDLAFFNFKSRFKNRYSTISTAPNNDQRLYVINSTWGRSGGLYQSDNGGLNWKLISNNMPESWLKTSKRMNDFAISQNDAKQMYLGSSRYIYASKNSGDSWKQVISKELDNGWTHRGINIFGHTREIKVDPNDKKIMYIGTADHKILKSINEGKSWNLLLENDNDANYIWDISICPNETSTIHMVTSDNNSNICFMSSDNKGETWKKNCSFKKKTNWKEKIKVAPANCNNILLSTNNSLYRSNNKGKTWGIINNNFKDAKIRAIEYDTSASDTYYVGTNKGMYTSNDAGKTWKLNPETADLIVTSIYKHHTANNELFIGTQISKKKPAELYKSINNGRTWKKVMGNLRRFVSAITALPSNPNILYASTLDDNYHDESKGSGIYRSPDRGDTWQRVDTTLPVFKAYGISTSKLNPLNIYIATGGSGAYVANDKDIMTLPLPIKIIK